MTEPQNAPTPEEMRQMQQVAVAGAEAGAASETPQEAEENVRTAVRAKADEVGLQLSDEEVDKIAETFAEKAIGMMEQRGAFDPPPEAVQPPPPAPPSPNEAANGDSEGPPRAKTFAEKFLGG